jgi:hypothetical protein
MTTIYRMFTTNRIDPNADYVLAADHGRVEDALRKAIATFDDMGRVLRLLGRDVLADACAVAADGSRDALEPTPAIKESNHE